jgi:hypothetical protein
VRLLAAVALVAVVIGGCSEIGLGETLAPPSGIRGTVLLGPTCPIGGEPGAHDPVPCLTPYSAELVVLDLESVVVERITSGTDGKFTVDLPPGEYVIAPEGGENPYPIAQPVPVTVAPGQYIEVEINYDTGIR